MNDSLFKLRPGDTSPFDRFWAAWPRHFRKVSKGKCKHVWKRDGLDKNAEHVIGVLEAMKTKWLEDGNKYVPSPLVFLNQQRWDCDIADITAAPTRKTVEEILADGENART